MQQVKFTAQGSNSQLGGFSPGDTLRTSEAMAKHLVDQGVAVYMNAPPPKPTKKPKQ